MPDPQPPAPSRTDAPRRGDLVILSVPKRHESHAFVIYRVQQRLTVLCKRYDDALDQTRRVAAAAHVDAWYSSDDQSFVRVAEYRRP